MKKKLKYLIIPILTVAISATLAFSAHAAEEVADEATESTEADSTNFFTEVYEDVAENAGEILCALTFVGSLVLSFAYKRGLMPLVEGSLVSIGNAVEKIGDNTRAASEKSAELSENINLTARTVQDLANKLEALELAVREKLEYEDGIRDERRQLALVVGAQIDMLYEIFMTSALPQYQKDAVGERIAKMKEAMAENAA